LRIAPGEGRPAEPRPPASPAGAPQPTTHCEHNGEARTRVRRVRAKSVTIRAKSVTRRAGRDVRPGMNRAGPDRARTGLEEQARRRAGARRLIPCARKLCR